MRIAVTGSNVSKVSFAVLLFCVAAAIAVSAQTFTTLVNFDGTNGAFPQSMSLVQGLDSNLYGATVYGGNYTVCSVGCGTIFKITPQGTLSDEYTFCPFPCTNGYYPISGLLLALDGNLYGTTSGGGAENAGSAYKFTPGGTLTTLYSFCEKQGACVDGSAPYAPLVQATDGNFYGTTTYGGANLDGTVFKLTTNGVLTTLYSFDSRDTAPFAPLIQAPDGNFYGTSPYGGTHDYGAVFKMTPTGVLTTLYSFCAQSGCPDGAAPYGNLVLAANGNFYGTTNYYGTNGEGGTIFEITPAGKLTTLYSSALNRTAPMASTPNRG